MTIQQQLYNALQELEMTSHNYINGTEKQSNLAKYLNSQKKAIHLLAIHQSTTNY